MIQTPPEMAGSWICISTYYWYNLTKQRSYKLATTVYDVVEIELSNGEVLTLKPLSIKHLKKFMAVIKKMDEAELESEDAAMEIFIQAAMVCLESTKPELSQDKDKFEDMIEIPTMMKILEVCGGLKLNDPNLLGAALVGTN